MHNQWTITFIPLTPSQVYKDQVRFQKESEQKEKGEKESEQKKESDKKKLIENLREKDRETEKFEREKKRE